MSKTQVNLSIDPANTQAILIGSSQFDDPKLLPLPAVKNNILALKRLLSHPSLVGIPERNINTKCFNARFRDDILKELVNTVKKTLETLIIYYAGHGVLGKEKNLYLATKKTSFATPEFSALAFKEMWDVAIDNRISGVKHIIFILDCCYSGRALEEFRLVGNKNVFILTATNRCKKAKAPVGDRYTAFTGGLVSILSDGINNGKNTLALSEIYNQLKTRLIAKNFPEPQHIYSPNTDRLEIVYNRIGQSTSRRQHSMKTPKPQLPHQSLLFYLPNRRPQRAHLKKAIQEHQQQYPDKKQRPLVCFLSSDTREYGNFMECLLGDFFPNNFYKYFCKSQYHKELHLEKFQTVEELHQALFEEFEEVLNVSPKKEAIAKKLARVRQPVVISTQIITDDWSNWKDHQKNLIDGFIEFWKDWPEIPAHHPLFLVFIFFLTKHNPKSRGSPFSWLKKWFLGRSSNIIDELNSLQPAFPTVKQFLNHKGVNGVILPPLQSVEKRHVRRWASDYRKTIEKCGGSQLYCNKEALSAQVEALYENRTQIPMRELASELEKILTNPNR